MYFQHSERSVTEQGIRFTTRHGFLVLTGFVADALGVRKVLEAGLRLKQKTYQHSPVDKVLQALVGILGGCRYMKDLNGAAAPVGKDRSVVRAWGQKVFAHYSTVCRTLRAFTAADVQRLADLLATITAPRLQREVERLVGPDGRGLVVVDVDLTGQKVRGETTQYTGTAFGYIRGQLARGYQIAAAFLDIGMGRFAIAGRLKPGNAQAASCLLELIPGIEAVVGRPLRRVEYVQRGIRVYQRHIRSLQAKLKSLTGRRGEPQRRRALERRLREAEETLAGLQARLKEYLRENAANPAPRRILLRADSHFGTAEVIQRCLELGYELLVKRYSVTPYRQVFESAPSPWIWVGKKRWAYESKSIPKVPLLLRFPLRQIALRRTDVDGKVVRSILATTLGVGEFSLHQVVRLYEGRQSIEAAFQECAHTFHFGTPRLRSEEANAAYTQLVLFAFNLVRWTQRMMVKSGSVTCRAGTRLWVRIAANCEASAQVHAHHCTLRFSRQSGLAGVRVAVEIPPDALKTGFSRCLTGVSGLFAPFLS